MVQEKIQTLDAVLRERHPVVYASLRPGAQTEASTPSQVQAWYEWKNGQSIDVQPEVFFLATYRFVPLEEGRGQAQSARSSVLANPLQAAATAIFARKDFYSWPLLTDGAGEGYFFNTTNQRVFYKFEGERDRTFRSFEGFLDFLIELAQMPQQDEEAKIERELELIDQYTS